MMQFKTWLENNNWTTSNYITLYYINHTWTPEGYRHAPEADISKNKKIIEFSNISIYSPEIRPAIQKLIKLTQQTIPDLPQYKTKFDGPPGPTLQEILNMENNEDWGYIQWFYHGTCTGTLDAIQQNGLQPRATTGSYPVYGTVGANAPEGNPNYVYLHGTDGNAVRFAARQANAKFKTNPTAPIILKIDAKRLNPQKFRPDHDSGSSNWQTSLYTIGSIGYEGIIRPELITIHLTTNNENQWVKP